VAANLSERSESVDLGDRAQVDLLLASHPDVELDGASVTLPPDSVAVLRTVEPHPLTQEPT
jgi:hypothetical protein